MTGRKRRRKPDLELRVMVEELLRRLPDLELAGPVQRLHSIQLFGPKHMPVKFTPVPVPG